MNSKKIFIRRAQDKDADSVLSLYKSVIGTKFCTWDENYPGQREIKSDLMNNSLFILEKEEQCIGAVSVVPENELDDQTCWQITENTNEIARVVISPNYQGNGYAAKMLNEITVILKNNGCRSIHLAVAVHNLPAQNVYFEHGYEKVGESDLYGHRFYLCEKKL